MSGLVAFAVILMAGLLLARIQARSFAGREQKLLYVGFGAHVLAALAQVGVVRFYYGGGDMLTYHRVGMSLAHLLRADFQRFAPEVSALVLQREAVVPVWLLSQGSPTGSMQGIAGWLCFALADSLLAICLLLSILSYFGQVALYRVFREAFAERMRLRLLAACLLVPSVVFWTSGLLKEAVAFPGFCLVVFGLRRYMRGATARGLLLAFTGAVPVALTKPYFLVALAVAAAVWWYWDRAMRARGGQALVIKPVYLVVGAAVAVVVVAALGNLFPRYAFENIAEETAQLQGIGTRVEGGSNYTLGDPEARSLGGQMAFAPLAIVTALFRPFLFEVSGATMLVNAVETTIISLLFLRVLVRQSWRRLWATTLASPMLVFCTAFVLTFGTAVGLASTNLGTLSRYRVPLVPFFVAVILVWDGLPRRVRSQRGLPGLAPGRTAAKSLPSVSPQA